MSWPAIMDLLRRYGVDAEAVTLDATRSLPDRSLRAEVERLAAWYAAHRTHKPPTPRQRQAAIQHDLDAIAAVQRQLEADFEITPSVTKKTRTALADYAAELQARRVAATARTARNDYHAVRDVYWFRLVAVWVDIIPHLEGRYQRRRNKPLRHFLQACTGKSESTIKNFIARLPGKVPDIIDSRILLP